MSYTGTSGAKRTAQFKLQNVASNNITIGATGTAITSPFGEITDFTREKPKTQITIDGTRSLENVAEYHGMWEPAYTVDFHLTNGKFLYLLLGNTGYGITDNSTYYSHLFDSTGLDLPYHSVEFIDELAKSDTIAGNWIESCSIKVPQNGVVDVSLGGMGLIPTNATKNPIIPPDVTQNEGNKESGADGASNSSTSFISAGSDFVTTGISSNDTLVITSGADIGSYSIASVTNLTTLVLSSALTATAGSLDFYITTSVTYNGEPYRFQHGGINIYDSTSRDLKSIFQEINIDINNTIERGPAFGGQNANYHTINKREVKISITVDIDNTTTPIIANLVDNETKFELYFTLTRSTNDLLKFHFPDCKILDYDKDYATSMRTTLDITISNADPTDVVTIGTLGGTKTAWSILVEDDIPDYSNITML